MEITRLERTLRSLFTARETRELKKKVQANYKISQKLSSASPAPRTDETLDYPANWQTPEAWKSNNFNKAKWAHKKRNKEEKKYAYLGVNWVHLIFCIALHTSYNCVMSLVFSSPRSEIVQYRIQTASPIIFITIYLNLKIMEQSITSFPNNPNRRDNLSLNRIMINIHRPDSRPLTVAASSEEEKERWLEDLDATIIQANDSGDGKHPNYLSSKSCSE